ncbi:MAG: nuclear transport factor 2 family protein [Rhodospirillaceae bacterium]|nr:nuclear transport factor 2 family protein [Rhodospirillaceae bacterium]
MSAKDIVVAFLTSLEARDLPKAASFLAPGAVMTFPDNHKFTSLDQLLAWSKGRYKFLRKTFKQFDERSEGGVTTVYVHGYLNGEWLDGSPAANIRFLDRFEIKDGKIIDQQVWNDLAEFRT